jgi:TolB-like protein
MGVVGWLVIQVIDTVSPRLGLPEWVPTLVIVMVLLGFPISLLLAWAFEITTAGLKKTEDVAEGESIVHTTGRKLNFIIIATLFFALGYFIWESRFSVDLPTQEIAIATVITDRSIAVLPFADFSSGGDQAWFADGLSEEILNSLVRIPDLKVASRTSSFAYRDSNQEIVEIARAIGVAHILEGSVRRSDTRLRITAQLIRAADGFHMWSENYDRTPDDAIAIQEDLAISISQALQTAMDPAALAAMAHSMCLPGI